MSIQDIFKSFSDKVSTKVDVIANTVPVPEANTVAPADVTIVIPPKPVANAVPVAPPLVVETSNVVISTPVPPVVEKHDPVVAAIAEAVGTVITGALKNDKSVDPVPSPVVVLDSEPVDVEVDEDDAISGEPKTEIGIDYDRKDTEVDLKAILDSIHHDYVTFHKELKEHLEEFSVKDLVDPTNNG